MFIDEGWSFYAGTELNVTPGRKHGPHTTNTGVTSLSMFTGNVDLTEVHFPRKIARACYDPNLSGLLSPDVFAVNASGAVTLIQTSRYPTVQARRGSMRS